MSESNNKRIAKNTIMLYFRLLICMGIAFFSSRELLLTLGEIDYGLVNVISGIVTMFSFLSGMLTTAVSRYLTYDLGRGDFSSLKKTFNLTQFIYFCLCFIIFILSETVGLWFFKYKIIIPEARLDASFWFFQSSILSFLLQILIIPYDSLIIAHENMKAYASISVVQAFFKLIIIYVLHLKYYDSLAFYGALLTFVYFITLVTYIVICKRKYSESVFEFYWNKNLFKELLAFSGWNLFGAISTLFSNVLVNVLLNNYFGPAVNAARAVAVQVSSAVSGFMSNFLVAARPQITKYWSIGNKKEMYGLIFRTAKFGYFLMLIMALPVLFETNFLFGIWLKQIPNYAIDFSRLIIIAVLVDTLSNPLMTAAQASGKVALYQSVLGTMLWLNFPLSWLFLYYGFPPHSSMWVSIGINLICLFLRLLLVKRVTQLPILEFFNNVIVKVISVTLFALIIPYIFGLYSSPSFFNSLIQCFLCVLSVIVSITLFGFSFEEHKKIVKELKRKFFHSKGDCNV